jgi:hypothetical protein
MMTEIFADNAIQHTWKRGFGVIWGTQEIEINEEWKEEEKDMTC